MKVLQMESELYCCKCHTETLHRVTYLNNSIKKIECLGCQKFIGSDIKFKKEMYDELVHRIGTKPYRVAKELNHHAFRTIGKLPMRMIQKPFSFAQEFKQSCDQYNKMKDSV